MPFGIFQTGPIEATSAQLLAAASAPIEIVPAPGPGKLVVILALTYELIFGSTAYSGGGNNSTYGATGVVAEAGGDDGVFSSSVSSVNVAGLPIGNTSPISTIENQPVVYGSSSGFTPLTGGDGTAVFQATYMVVDV